ncbi:hypothetical protein KIPB_008152 [Kipferlia bialata]|uniref:Uncharacterized protein n=1 Tax=Kipferlia bialata TaxID=797122 RepID=A0A9K3D2D7_9EUKA|nr:hypothetical protein KIPB_008152 [Kipferlia bialata]|eukprot:g8152.t1
MRETLQKLTQRAKALGEADLPTILGHMITYTPLAKKIGPQLAELQRFLSLFPLKQIPSEDCSSLHRSLSSLCTPFCATLNAISACAFDPVKALCTISKAGG